MQTQPVLNLDNKSTHTIVFTSYYYSIEKSFTQYPQNKKIKMLNYIHNFKFEILMKPLLHVTENQEPQSDSNFKTSI